MQSVAEPVGFGAAGILLWAGLEKVRVNSAFARTLDDLHFPRHFSELTRFAVPVSEILVASALLLVPSAAWPRYGMLALAVAFAVAGALGLRSGGAISCTCFGLTGRSVLGWRQLIALPGWALAFIVLERQTPVWSLQDGSGRLAALAMILAATRGLFVARAAMSARGDRRALNEAAVQIPPMVALIEGQAP